MYEQTVEILSRRAASISRRGSLLSLGGALATVIDAPALAEGKKTKKGRKKARRKAAERAENEANQICQSQVAACRAHIAAVCDGPDDTCLAAADCCSSLGVCNTAGFFSCLESLSAGE